MSDSLDQVISKIHKLSAMAQYGTEHEASVAAGMMQALLAKHNLDMAQIAVNANTGPAHAARVKEQSKMAAMYKFQRTLMSSVADNNFCRAFVGEVRVPHEKKKGQFRTVKRFSLLGSKVNVTVALHMYEYLMQTMDRLLPYSGMEKRGKDALLWLDGCSDRLGNRLWQRKQEMIRASKKQEEERQAAARHPSAAPSVNALVLSDVYSSEDDLNQDHVWNFEPGTTARNRKLAEAKRNAMTAEDLAAQEARWAKQAAEWEAEKVAKLAAETPAQRAKREAKEAREDQRRKEKQEREWAKYSERASHPAYLDGRAAANEIGLDAQVEEEMKRRIG